ncbi:MAG: flagellar motor protein [Planctomycetota bacterium]|nr:flagellar motor protein [Planctomycetota bacterium]
MERTRRSRGRGPRGAGVIALGVALAGCASVPRGQMEDCRQQSLALQAELSQTKDLAARLRTQNRDMAARSVEDARRLTALEETNDRLERSITAYQDERNQYAAALDQIKSQVLASGGSSESRNR